MNSLMIKTLELLKTLEVSVHYIKSFNGPDIAMRYESVSKYKSYDLINNRRLHVNYDNGILLKMEFSDFTIISGELYSESQRMAYCNGFNQDLIFGKDHYVKIYNPEGTLNVRSREAL